MISTRRIDCALGARARNQDPRPPRVLLRPRRIVHLALLCVAIACLLLLSLNAVKFRDGSSVDNFERKAAARDTLNEGARLPASGNTTAPFLSKNHTAVGSNAQNGTSKYQTTRVLHRTINAKDTKASTDQLKHQNTSILNRNGTGEGWKFRNGTQNFTLRDTTLQPQKRTTQTQPRYGIGNGSSIYPRTPELASQNCFLRPRGVQQGKHWMFDTSDEEKPLPWVDAVARGKRLVRQLHFPPDSTESQAIQSKFTDDKDLEKYGWRQATFAWTTIWPNIRPEEWEVLRSLGSSTRVCEQELNFAVGHGFRWPKDASQKSLPSGAYYTDSVVPNLGVIFARDLRSPAQTAKSIDRIPPLQFWSDIIFLKLMRMVRPSLVRPPEEQLDLKKITGVVHTNIINHRTIAIMDRALQDNEKDIATAPWPGVTFHSTGDAEPFEALLGSDNGIGSGYLLSQHKEQLGWKTVDYVRVWGQQSTVDDYWEYYMSLSFKNVGDEESTMEVEGEGSKKEIEDQGSKQSDVQGGKRKATDSPPEVQGEGKGKAKVEMGKLGETASKDQGGGKGKAKVQEGKSSESAPKGQRGNKKAKAEGSGGKGAR